MRHVSRHMKLPVYVSRHGRLSLVLKFSILAYAIRNHRTGGKNQQMLIFRLVLSLFKTVNLLSACLAKEPW